MQRHTHVHSSHSDTFQTSLHKSAHTCTHTRKPQASARNTARAHSYVLAHMPTHTRIHNKIRFSKSTPPARQHKHKWEACAPLPGACPCIFPITAFFGTYLAAKPNNTIVQTELPSKELPYTRLSQGGLCKSIFGHKLIITRAPDVHLTC